MTSPTPPFLATILAIAFSVTACSTRADFSAFTELISSTSNATYAMIFRTFTPIVVLAPGETLVLRIYPYLYNGSAVATGKSLCLQSLTVHGTAQ